MNDPLIESVFSNVEGLEPDREDVWMEWYDYHQLLMCRLPEWSWAFRYLGLAGPDKYLSLYRLESHDALKHITGWPRVDLGQFEPTREKMHPAALEDWYYKVDHDLTDAGKYTFTGGAGAHNPEDQGHWGWRLLAGAGLNDPFLNRNLCIGTELVSVPHAHSAKWIEWYKNHRLQALASLPEVSDVALFGITTTGQFFEPGYNFITIFEVESEETAMSLASKDGRSPEAAAYEADKEAATYRELARDVRVNYYKPISRHWSFEK